MGDWFIATEGVKIVKDSASLWPQIITAVSSAGAALGGVYLAHYFTRRREERAVAAKQASERLFIATELVFLIEQFVEGCAGVATDRGDVNSKAITVPIISVPVLDYSAVAGDWRVLPAKLMYRIRELPVIQGEADRTIHSAEHIPPDFDEFFEARQYQYTRLGLKAIIQARRLRQLAGLPHTRLDATAWSAQNVLWKEWRQERKRRRVLAVLMAQSLAPLSIEEKP
ncbi:TPA: hypothetical protein ACKP7A_004685 [Serratia liquefaciens]|jgi:hypothetical protein|uniref:hypothetical protein n=1 Tax=Serratia TaxID=613 RepID=UPI001021B38C|nr:MULTISPECIES: hypothetical protein [Serratia]RYM68074.1 hypothetical protein BSR00_24565 [Serratia liquefaciens]RYM76551.1 hypothetical protein BSR01_21095 [Serratia liquefaciens]CAI1208465.1 Uncharacterised protein [Serratia liquefaciens]CAI2018167.1 Uncharacterised protein [Serratia liquefaciens]CAI2021958.1 Uncharacterised protein [Serratia liquefaciens]